MSTESLNPADDLFMRFEDGPMHGVGNISNLGGGMDVRVSREVYGWPLPKRLAVLKHEGVENVAMWDADDPDGAHLPIELVRSPNVVVYEKLSESLITDEQAATMTRVIRGAQYRLERPEWRGP